MPRRVVPCYARIRVRLKADTTTLLKAVRLKAGIATLAAAVLVCVVWTVPHAAPQSGRVEPALAPAGRAFVETYCVTCHNERVKSSGLAFDAATLADVPAHADVWEKAIRKVRSGMMPPPAAPQPD